MFNDRYTLKRDKNDIVDMERVIDLGANKL